MRVIKISGESWKRALKMAGKKAQFVRLPSTVENYFFIGLLMADGVWVAWPDNLTDSEMDLYLERYGTPPDIFELDPERKEYLRMNTEEDVSGTIQ